MRSRYGPGITPTRAEGDRVLDLEVVVGEKVRALASRNEPRDYADVAADRSPGIRSCAQRNGR